MKEIRSRVCCAINDAQGLYMPQHLWWAYGVKTAPFFVRSAGLLLVLTGMAKLISAAGAASLLQTPDPVFGIPFRALFLVVGAAEVLAGLVCIFTKRPETRISLLVWLALSFVVYRIEMTAVGYQSACPCLGTLTQALHLSPARADYIMQCVLSYILLGSCALAAVYKVQKKRLVVHVKSGERIEQKAG